jgi:uncharacterized protein YcbX
MHTRVVALRRYPVKSMGGEPLHVAELDRRGLVGDRGYAVVDEDGRFASGKTTRRFRRRDAVFEFAAHTVEDEVWVLRRDRAWRIGDPALDATLSEALEATVTVAAEDSVPHHDAGPVSIVGTASLEWCREHLGVDADPRRLRANVVVATSIPFVEESWVGRDLTVGGARLSVVAPIERCRTIDLDQDGMGFETPWLAALGRTRSAQLGVYADVETPGRVAVGDELVLPHGH